MVRSSRKPNIPWANRSPYGWWVASYIQRFEYKGQPRMAATARCLAWENMILIRAKSRELAYTKAIRFAKEASPRRWNLFGDPPGRLGRWVFEGLTSLTPIYDPLEDGSEIIWTEHRNTTLSKVRRRIKAKHLLEVFIDKEKP